MYMFVIYDIYIYIIYHNAFILFRIHLFTLNCLTQLMYWKLEIGSQLLVVMTPLLLSPKLLNK